MENSSAQLQRPSAPATSSSEPVTTETLIAGAIAGVVAETLMHPFETVRLQCNNVVDERALDLFRIFSLGVTAMLCSGNGLVGALMVAVLLLLQCSWYRVRTGTMGKQSSTLELLFIIFSSAVVSTVVTVPADESIPWEVYIHFQSTRLDAIIVTCNILLSPFLSCTAMHASL